MPLKSALSKNKLLKIEKRKKKIKWERDRDSRVTEWVKGWERKKKKRERKREREKGRDRKRARELVKVRVKEWGNGSSNEN